MTKFGLNCHLAERDAHREIFGPRGYVRFFFAPGRRFSWDRWPLTLRYPDEIPVISVKTWNELDFRNLLLTKPANVPYFVFAIHHEPEKEIMTGSLDPNKMNAEYERARDMISDTGMYAHCELATIFARYPLVVKKFNWRQLTGALESSDFVGVDTYVSAQFAGISAEELFSPAESIANEIGISWSVPEFGVLDADPLAISQHMRHMHENHAVWASYWCNLADVNDPSSDNYHLELPGNEDGLNTWRTGMWITS